MRRRFEALLLLTGLAGCSGGASHIPPLWQLPGAAVSTAVENASYETRRREVKRLLVENERVVVREVDLGGGPQLAKAMEAARVPRENRATLIAELRENPEIYRREDNRDRLDIEAVTVALMVYGE